MTSQLHAVIVKRKPASSGFDFFGIHVLDCIFFLRQIIRLFADKTCRYVLQRTFVQKPINSNPWFNVSFHLAR